MSKIKNWKKVTDEPEVIAYEHESGRYVIEINSIAGGNYFPDMWSIDFYDRDELSWDYIHHKEFRTKEEALKHVRNYMKTHPNGV